MLSTYYRDIKDNAFLVSHVKNANFGSQSLDCDIVRHDGTEQRDRMV